MWKTAQRATRVGIDPKAHAVGSAVGIFSDKTLHALKMLLAPHIVAIEQCHPATRSLAHGAVTCYANAPIWLTHKTHKR